MSFASSRIPTQLASASIGTVLQQGADATVVLPLTLVSGALTAVATVELQQGLWTGYAVIGVQGDNTTAFEFFNIIEDNVAPNPDIAGVYLVATTLPTTDVFQIKYPITRSVPASLTNNEFILSVDAVFTGTAPEITAVSITLVKVV